VIFDKGEVTMRNYLKLAVLLCCISTFLMSCETVPDKVTEDVTEGLEQLTFISPQEPESTTSIDEDEVTTLEYGEEKVPAVDLKTLEYKAKSTRSTEVEPFYKKWIKQPGKVIGVKGQVIAFDAVPISDVVFALSDSLGFEYIIDPQVTGSVTMSMDASQLNIEDAWQIFEQILWLSGAYCSPIDDTGRRLHILPFSKMPQERRMLSSHKGSANVEVAYFNIRHASSKEVVAQIKPFLTPGATAFDLPRQNAILLIEAPENIPKLHTLMTQLDKKNRADWPQVVVPCYSITASHIIDELSAVLPVLGFPVTTDLTTELPGAIHLTSLDRIQVIIASAANTEAIDELKRWVSILDKSDIGEQEKVFVYNVINSKADELFAALSSIFNINGTSLSPSANKSSDGSETATTKSAKSQSNKMKESGDAPNVFDVPINLFADEVHNRFLIRTTPRAYAMVKAVLNRMDSVTPQVLIQVMIAEITLSDELDFGIEFRNKNISGSATHIYGTDYGSGLKGDSTELPGGHGAKYWIKDVGDKFVYIRALAGKNNTKVLSTPQILTESHQEAIISVGTDISIRTSEDTDVSNPDSGRSNYQYKETGIILSLTPHITKGGMISIEMDQEISDIVLKEGQDNPDISRSQFKTRLSIRDNGTVVVGGLIKETKTHNEENIPFIMDIPYLKYLFGTTTKNTKRTELLVLITGRIVRKDSKLEEMTKRYDDAMDIIKNRFEGKEEE